MSLRSCSKLFDSENSHPVITSQFSCTVPTSHACGPHDTCQEVACSSTLFQMQHKGPEDTTEGSSHNRRFEHDAQLHRCHSADDFASMHANLPLQTLKSLAGYKVLQSSGSPTAMQTAFRKYLRTCPFNPKKDSPGLDHALSTLNDSKMPIQRSQQNGARHAGRVRSK